jgi:hypothetical protein
MSDGLVKFLAILGIVCVFLFISILSVWLFMWAWSLILVGLFHLPMINWLQALAVLILLGFIKGIFSVTVRNS